MDNNKFLDDYESKMAFYYEWLHSHNAIQISDIDDLQASNKKLQQDIFFFDYLRISAISAVEAYHNYLREKLKDTIHIDIGDFPS